MSFRKLYLLLATLLVIWGSGINQASASPVLIKLQLKEQSDYQKAEALNVSAYHRFDNLFIAEFKKSELKVLQDVGLSYEIIDEEPWTECYYVISESPRCEKVDLSQYGKILLQSENLHFLKISDQGAQNLAGKGYNIIKVFRHDIPLKYKCVPEELRKPVGYDPGIDSLLSLISVDSLYAWTLRMQNFQTRHSYSDSIHAARQWIFDKFVSFGIDSVWFHHFYHHADDYNVVATVEGTNMPDIVIVVGGHYDSAVYGTGTNPYVWAPGADDNASGTVATMEIARIITQNPLPVTVIFIAFGQEEQGLIGSYHFAEYLYDQETYLELMLNADMIGHSVDADTDVAVKGASSAIHFVEIMMDMANTYTYLKPYYGGQSWSSDNYSFYQWGYDALRAQEGDFFGAIHTNYDIVDSLDFEYMREVVKMELATLITAASPYSVEGPWLIYRSHQIDDSGGNANAVINPGETNIGILVTVKNYGSETAYGASGTLRTDDDFVFVKDSIQYFPEILPRMTAQNTELYLFDVDPSCPDSHQIIFELEFTDDSTTWIAHFQEIVADTDFTISATPLTEMVQGDSACIVLIATSVGGFGSQVDLVVSGLPPGVTGVWNPGELVPPDTSSLTIYTTTDAPGGIHPIAISATGGGITHEIPLSCVILMRGDANGDGEITIADAVYLIRYLFQGGSSPEPIQIGDANCNSEVNIVDVVYLINYIFRGGPPPNCE